MELDSQFMNQGCFSLLKVYMLSTKRVAHIGKKNHSCDLFNIYIQMYAFGIYLIS